MKNYSVWYNSNGWDECFGKFKGESLDKVFVEIKKEIGFVEGEVKDLEIEMKGEGWVMYVNGEIGYGIFEVENGYNVKKCKKEYDKLFWE